MQESLMPDHRWNNHWNWSNDYSDRHSGCDRHQSSYKDDDAHERMRGWQSDFHDNGDQGDPPNYHFRDSYGHRGNDDASVGSMQPHDGGNLGWDAPAWADAGGFEAVLFGHLANNLGPAGGFPPIVVFAIEDLDIEFNTLIQTTQTQNTLALLNASNGGSIDVGGDVTAIGLQSASTEQMAGLLNFQDFA
jgi:hypothetical protein